MKSKVKSWSKWEKVILIIIYGLFIGICINTLRINFISGDEDFTYGMINHSFESIVNLTAQDVHPFLYYFIAKIFAFNVSNVYLKIGLLRFASMVPYLLLLIVGQTYIKKYFSKFVALFFMLTMITMPGLIQNISNIRMYGWSLLFNVVLFLLLSRTIQNKNKNNFKYFIWITIFSLLSAYTHNFGLITVAITETLFLIYYFIYHQTIKNILWSIGIETVLYFPWLIVLIHQSTAVTKNFWTLKASWSDMFEIISDALLPTSASQSVISNDPIFIKDQTSPLNIALFLFIIIFCLLFLYLFIKHWKRYSSVIKIGLLQFIILLFSTTMISFISGHNLLMFRYTSMSLGIVWLVIGMMIESTSIDDLNAFVKKIMLGMIIFLGLSSYIFYQTNLNHSITQFQPIAEIKAQIPKNASIIYTENENAYDSSIYFNNNYLLNLYHKKWDDNELHLYFHVFNNFKIIHGHDNETLNAILKRKNVYIVQNGKYVIPKINSHIKFKNIGSFNFPNDTYNNQIYKKIN